MNDSQLDQLLDTWEAPAPSAALRAGLRDRFPRTERRRRFVPRLRWLVTAAAIYATLALATGQTSDSPLDRLWVPFERLYNAIVEVIEIRQGTALMIQIANADPQVFVDNVPAPPPQSIHAGIWTIEVPGDGAYFVMLSHPRGLEGFTEAGRLKDNVLEFQAGSHHVRIVCNRPVNRTQGSASTELPVYVKRF